MKSIIAFVIAPLIMFASSASALEAGEVVEVKKVRTMSIDAIKALKKYAEIKSPTRTRYTLYKLKYGTTNLRGKIVVASAGVAVPIDIPLSERSIISYQHGTISQREGAPSRWLDLETTAAAATFASNGYLVVAADYLGLGDNWDTLHPYLHADSEASAAADALRAVFSLKLSESKKLFFAGFSQGGHATMALHRYWQQRYALEYPVTAAAPMAGPFDLFGTFMHDATSNEFAETTTFSSAYLVMGLRQVYQFFGSLDQVFRPPYDKKVLQLFNGMNSMDRIIAQLPRNPLNLFTSEFYQAITTDANHPFMRALAANSVWDWIPRAPTQLCHGTADVSVKPFNSVNTYQYMKGLGADVSLVLLEGKGHRDSAVPCMNATSEFFEKMQANDSASPLLAAAQ